MRFVVRTVTGFSTAPTTAQSSTRKPGVTAMVLDTVYNWRTVAQYRSEERDPHAARDALGRLTGQTRYGIDGALAAAHAHAARLNDAA